jgi:DNA-binding NarL/FixJ family response regulator
MRLHGLASVVPAPLSVLVEVRLECGDVDGAAALLGDGPADASRGFSMFDLFLLRARAQVHLAQGNHRQALQELRQGLERTALIGYRSPTFLPWHADLAVALAAAGDPAGAAAHAETAALLAEECGSDRARADALCARAAAGTDGVVTVLEQAVAGYARAGAVLQEARATLELAEARRRAGDTDGSVELLERVLQLSQRSGSSLLEHRAKAQLTSLGARMRRRPASGVDALTPSERRVAELAAAGLRNKEIAQELFLTVKTVESHLAKTFQKLGIASRTDVAPALRAAAAPSRVRV